MDWQIIVDSIPAFLGGMGLTVQLTLISLIAGFFLAIPLGVLRLSSNPILSAPILGFIFFFCGAPRLVQIFLIYCGSGQLRPVLQEWGF